MKFLCKPIYALPITLLVLLVVTLLLNHIDLWTTWSRLGDEEFYVIAAVLIYYVVLPNMYTGIAPITAVLLSGALNVLLKYTFNMPRPENPLVEVSGPGFPSGHAQVSSSFWSSLAFLSKSKPIALISGILVAGISLSRIYLRAHYEVDVAGGVLIGTAVGWLSFVLNRYSTLKNTGIPYVIGASVITAISFYNILVMNVEHSSMSAVAGLGLASLTSVLFVKNKFSNCSKVSLATKTSLCFLSIILLLGIHLVTKELPVYTRVGGFYVAGSVVLLLPIFISRSRPYSNGVRCLPVSEKNK